MYVSVLHTILALPRREIILSKYWRAIDFVYRNQSLKYNVIYHNFDISKSH